MTKHHIMMSAAAALAVASPATAQEAARIDLDNMKIDKSYDAQAVENTVTLYFRGALAGENIAEMLDFLYKNVEGLPTRTSVIEKNGSICQVLADARFPSPCTAYLPLVQQLSSIKNPNLVWVGQEVTYPDFDLKIFRSSRPAGKMSDALIDNISENFPHLDVKLSKSKRDGSLRIEFDTFELEIKAPDEPTRNNLIDTFVGVDMADTFVETAGFRAKNGSIYNVNQEKARQLCDAGEIHENPVDYSGYAGSVVSDLDWASDALGVGPAKIEPRLYVLDVKLLDAPNLIADADNPDASDDPTWECEWQSWSPVYHATHLAGIVASRTDKLGFLGLEPKTDIKSLPYLYFESPSDTKPDIDNNMIKIINRTFAREYGSSEDLAIFLMASSYREPEHYANEPLDNPAHRFERNDWAIEKFIKEQEPLLIVSAGQQVRENNEPMDIKTTTPLAPQNLGDLKNVVSVTACKNCGTSDAMIDDLFNFSADGLVHVAAPGGEGIPGWVNTTGIGASMGTSQASAFAAGVAARMVARYPRIYSNPDRVKTRLQTTSRPMVDANGDQSPSAEKIATGIVDPRLAILDPEKDWLKTRSGWKPVKAKYWSKKSAFFVDAAGDSDPVALARVQRVVQHEGGRFTVYQTAKTRTGTTIKGKVQRRHLFGLDSDESEAELQLCDGTSVPFSEINDFLPRLGGVEVAPATDGGGMDFGLSPCD